MKFCLYCPDDCTIQGEHHHLPGKQFDHHSGKKIEPELGGLKLVEQE